MTATGYVAALVADRSGTTYVGHSGGGSIQGGGYYQGPYPEETIEGFAAAQAAGVTWLNPHVSMLGDGALVLMHDSTPDRTTDATGEVNVGNYSTAAWKKLTVTPENATLWPGYGVDWGVLKAPFFAEYLETFSGRVAHLIECSSRSWQAVGDVAEAVVAMLQARGLEDTAIIQGFAAGELTPAAAAGLHTMYLPPDLGTAGSDAATIQSTMTAAAGWASGKPKHVGINAFPSGQTQAQVVTYIGTLIDAGFTVWAYVVTRRYDRDWLTAAGVVGIIADEPVYLATSAKTQHGGVDQLSLGVWPHGFQPADQARGRGTLAAGGVKLDYTGASGAQLCCYGGLCPPASLTAYTLQADFVWDQLDTDTTRYPQIVFACPDDRKASMIAGTGNGMVDGYQVIFRQAGSAMVVSKFVQSTQTSSTLLNQTSSLPPAPSATTVTTFKIQVTATQLIVSLIQASTTYGPWTVNDSTYRGGFFHLGKNASPSGTKLIGTWKTVTCA